MKGMQSASNLHNIKGGQAGIYSNVMKSIPNKNAVNGRVAAGPNFSNRSTKVLDKYSYTLPGGIKSTGVRVNQNLTTERPKNVGERGYLKSLQQIEPLYDNMSPSKYSR